MFYVFDSVSLETVFSQFLFQYPIPMKKETQGKTDLFIGNWLRSQQRDKVCYWPSIFFLFDIVTLTTISNMEMICSILVEFLWL